MTQEEFEAEKVRQLAALKEWEERRNGSIDWKQTSNTLRVTLRNVTRNAQ